MGGLDAGGKTAALTLPASVLLFMLSTMLVVVTSCTSKKGQPKDAPSRQTKESDNSSGLKSDVLKRRRKHFSKSQTISYENSDPLLILQGKGCRLIDETNTSYLDTRNNVAHCGHSHSSVVSAVQNQIQKLNTNTRYLHPTVVKLAEKLISLLPEPLEVVFFCNSGSEANDLALRLARAFSGGSTNTIVVDHAYHGHTLATLEVSPYKYESGSECPKIATPNRGVAKSPGSHIWQTPCPNVYRGQYSDPETAGPLYAKDVQNACRYYAQRGEKVRAMIMESGMSVGGVILPPPGYLAACAAAVREAGGLFIADEVQTGCGRIGSNYWAFEYNNSRINEAPVVPDIVTIGKPLGNGMPIAAVVTTREVAASFERLGVEYFNTFGGNPVCAAAALAVLETVEREKLQENAKLVGEYLMSEFTRLQRIPNSLVGDVRGSGLFIGVELVREMSTKEPATKETSFICSILKTKYHILTTIDGEFDNVIVIKPPMVFSPEDAGLFVRSFEQAMFSDLPSVDLTRISITPT